MLEDKLAEICEHANAIKTIIGSLKEQDNRVLNVTIGGDMPAILLFGENLILQDAEFYETNGRYFTFVAYRNNVAVRQLIEDMPAMKGEN